MLETTDFRIKSLNIVLKNGSKDISQIFEELNLFDNLFTPCMSGNIVIRDAIGLINQITLDGNEFIEIEIDKVNGADSQLLYKKSFRIQKIANRTNVNETAQVYVLHFVAKEYLISQSKKVKQYYLNTYTNIVKNILTQYLDVRYVVPEIMILLPSSGVYELIVPTLSPFDAINWISRRAVWTNDKPDFVFYQVPTGYCFASLSYLVSLDARFTINFQPKDVNDRTDVEFLGARDMKILTQNSITDNLSSGVYGGTFVGFDTMTRRWTQKTLTFEELYGSKRDHANDYANIPVEGEIPEGKISGGTFAESRISSYPFQIPRATDGYILANNPHIARYTDNTHEYFFQRRHNLGNLHQRRIQLTMPGNFSLFSGGMVNLEMPKHSTKDSGDGVDPELDGKYIITATRHTIKYDRHETLIEVATDSSTRRRTIPDSVQDQNNRFLGVW